MIEDCKAGKIDLIVTKSVSRFARNIVDCIAKVRELANMINVGIIKSDSADNKLYYEVDQRYEHYVPLRTIFGDTVASSESIDTTKPSTLDWQSKMNYVS